MAARVAAAAAGAVRRKSKLFASKCYAMPTTPAPTCKPPKWGVFVAALPGLRMLEGALPTGVPTVCPAPFLTMRKPLKKCSCCGLVNPPTFSHWGWCFYCKG